MNVTLIDMNALVVTFDQLPLRMLGCYGNDWIATPHFDRLSAESVVFDAHFADATSHSQPSDAWWTGQHRLRSSPIQAGEAPDERPCASAPLPSSGTPKPDSCPCTLQCPAARSWRRISPTPSSRTSRSSTTTRREKYEDVRCIGGSDVVLPMETPSGAHSYRPTGMIDKRSARHLMAA